MSDTMSDMQKLTVRELSRETARVLSACDQAGEVVIRHSDGREYVLTPTVPRRPRGKRQLPDFAKRMAANFGSRVFSEKFVGGILDKGEH
ncbi:hypothetical protein LBMAG56_38560 [Verrucomicrobiota bacterium]|nr:hypothetical protein LBMAG56_38560 [Verrucomicrobiota bacterium]